VVKEVLTTLGPMAEAKSLKFSFNIPEEEVIVRTDRRFLCQILLNLTYNAIKFTEKTGEVKIELRRLNQNGQQRTELSVLDTGIGINPDDQKKLFHAFSQVDTSSSRRHDGTGLGLHLSKKLVELLKGHIAFRSEPGRGSEFTIVLEEN